MRKIQLLRKLSEWRRRGRNNYYLLLIASVIVGFFTGLGALILKNSVHLVHELILPISNNHNLHWGFFVFPFLGMIVAYFYLKFTKFEINPGIPNLLFSISKNSGYIKPHNIFSSIIGAILTIGLGSPAGLESPNITTGGAIGSYISKLFKLPYRQRILLLGIASAATISAIFKAPFTGIVFTLEVIMIDLTSFSVIPIILASVTASMTSFFFTGNNFLYAVNLDYVFNFKDIPVYLIIGLAGGFFALIFSETYKKSRTIFLRIKKVYWRFIIAGLLIGLLVYVFPPIFAEGYIALNAAIDGNYAYLVHNDFLFGEFVTDKFLILFFLAIALAKMFATILTVSSGGIGGFFTPVLFVGANVGLFISHTISALKINFSHQAAPLISMGALIAGMMHAPLTGVFFIAELTGGYVLLIPLLISTTIAYLFIKIFQEHNFFSDDLAKRKILLTHNADSNILTLLNISKMIEKNFVIVTADMKLKDLVLAVEEATRDLFPVVDCEGLFLGVVSLNRIRKIMFKQDLYEKIHVSELMTHPEVVVEMNEHLEEVAEKFEKTHVFNLVVLDKGKYVGFISRSNFFLQYRELLKRFSSN